MRDKLKAFLSDEGLRARVLRSIGLTAFSFGSGNVLRLISNLLLTRLLFPEAFGMMALVQVFVSGLQMLSDAGLRLSIMQSDRGDDEDFLNTAWTLQVIRGFLLWLGACALAIPMSHLYDEPMLAVLLPIVGLNTIISGFAPTKVASANRHLRMGLVTRIELVNQVVALIITVSLAYMLQSVWALVLGGVIGNTIKVVRQHIVLPGIRNRFFIDRSAVSEMFNFGKFIFFSTVAGFAINQGDRLILGGYISLGELGVYNIAMMLAGIPFGISSSIGSKVIFPMYRLKPPAESRENQRKIFKARRLLTAGLLAFNAMVVYLGIWLVDTLYDPRYALAGPIVVLVSVAMVPRIVLAGYGNILLSNGDSKRHFIQLVTTASVQLTIMFLGVQYIGLAGVVLAPAVAPLLLYPMRIAFTGRYKAWDPLHDGLFLTLGLSSGAFACWLHWERISVLF